MRYRTLQHAAAAAARRSTTPASVGMRGQKALDQALDPFGIRAVPMTKAMQRAFRAGKRFETENCGHHIQGCAMKGVAVFRAGAAVHRHDIPPHVTDGVEGRAAGLVKVRQMQRTGLLFARYGDVAGKDGVPKAALGAENGKLHG